MKSVNISYGLGAKDITIQLINDETGDICRAKVICEQEGRRPEFRQYLVIPGTGAFNGNNDDANWERHDLYVSMIDDLIESGKLYQAADLIVKDLQKAGIKIRLIATVSRNSNGKKLFMPGEGGGIVRFK